MPGAVWSEMFVGAFIRHESGLDSGCFLVAAWLQNAKRLAVIKRKDRTNGLDGRYSDLRLIVVKASQPWMASHPCASQFQRPHAN